MGIKILLMFLILQIHEGSYVYAGAIVNKLIEVMDRQYAAASIAPINCSN